MNRTFSHKLSVFLDQFPILLVHGARQVGKTTFLKHRLNDWTHLDLEDTATAERLRADPALYLEDHPERVWFDEAHRVPELFAALRVAVDRDRRPGRYILSGSASGAMLSKVSESLAGRAAVLDLQTMSAAELDERPAPDFLQQVLDAKNITQLADRLKEKPRREQVDARWFAGGFPEPALMKTPLAWRRWYDAYLRLVSERDLGALHESLRPTGIRRLLRLLATRQGAPLNMSALGRDFGASSQAISKFIDILEGSGLWWRQESWQRNIGKRIVKSPRGWISDSGLLHALLDLRKRDDLDVHPLAGMSFEGWVIQQLRVQAGQMDGAPRFYYWRTQAGAEVDLVIEHGRRLIPVEIKRGRRVAPYDLRGMTAFLEAFEDKAPFGLVIHRTESPGRLREKILSVALECVV
ncbi:MAG: ATP-binding protein [Deltaproteobacteria bacterium]|nr:ATP-binding protein [Deltaproteobacteria bacterium]